MVEQYSSVSLAVCDESLNQLIFQCDTLWEMDFFKCAGMYVQASNKVKGYISYRHVQGDSPSLHYFYRLTFPDTKAKQVVLVREVVST